MEKDAQKWNRVFSDRTGPPAAPNEFIARQHQRLRPGTVLDIASGDGANALFLADQAFAVTAIDISAVGLARLAQFAADRQLQIFTRIVDLDYPDQLAPLTHFDNLVISRFKPSHDTWPRIVACLAPGGLMAVSTFNLNHHTSTGFKRQFCLAPDELKSIHPDLELIRYEDSHCGDPSMDSYLFRRLATT